MKRFYSGYKDLKDVTHEHSAEIPMSSRNKNPKLNPKLNYNSESQS